MDYQRTTTRIEAPAASPIDLNAGRPHWREIAPLFGLMLVCVIPVGIGGMFIVFFWPEQEYGLTGLRAIFIGVGGLLAFGGGSVFLSMRATITYGIGSYYRRVEDWHQAVLDKYQASDGRVVAEQIDERYLHITRPTDMLLLLSYIFLSERTPTVRGLVDGALMVPVSSGRGKPQRMITIGRVRQDTAEQALRLFASAGIIEGRGERQAGRVSRQDWRSAAQSLLREMAQDPRTWSVEQEAE